jgi:hypothetical protein
MTNPASQSLPSLLQNAGVPFDMLIQALTDQLDKAQATMVLKARVGKMPMTFAVKDVSIDLQAFVQMVDDDVYIRPARPGDTGASSVKLALTTITKPMIEENAMNYQVEDPKFSLREILKDQINEEERRSLERIGVRSIGQLNELRQSAGADVVARLARMPVTRLQQAMLAASAPRVTRVERDTPVDVPVNHSRLGDRLAPSLPPASRLHIEMPTMRKGTLPTIRAAGMLVPVVQAQDQSLVLQPLAHQMGTVAEMDFGDGNIASVHLSDGSFGAWIEPSASSFSSSVPIYGAQEGVV